jgi:two-component sensor histidine kinase
MHKLLVRQLNRAFGGNVPTIPSLDSFVAAIDEAYEGWDSDREILERSLDITSRIMIEKNEALRTAKETAEKAREQAEGVSRDKDLLLQEIHHRVKNNLQVIVSLLSLQAGTREGEACRSCFSDVTERVRSMAMVHEMLYESSDFSALDFSEYVERIAKSIVQPDSEFRELFLRLNQVHIGIDQAVPCGLIITEALLNALKYGRDEQGKLRVTISLSVEDICVVLEISDSGPGFPPGFPEGGGKKFGHVLMTSLASQAIGEIHFENRGGAMVRLVIARS